MPLLPRVTSSQRIARTPSPRLCATVVAVAPAAARYAGFSTRRALWTALLLSGGMAGLAGALEVAGPLGQQQTRRLRELLEAALSATPNVVDPV